MYVWNVFVYARNVCTLRYVCMYVMHECICFVMGVRMIRYEGMYVMCVCNVCIHGMVWYGMCVCTCM